MKKNKILWLAAMATLVLASCGKSGGRPNFGDNEFPVTAIKRSRDWPTAPQTP